MVGVRVAAAVLGGAQRSRLLLPREQGLFPFPSSPDHCWGYVVFPPSQGSFRAGGQALACPPKGLLLSPGRSWRTICQVWGAGDCLLLTSCFVPFQAYLVIGTPQLYSKWGTALPVFPN